MSVQIQWPENCGGQLCKSQSKCEGLGIRRADDRGWEKMEVPAQVESNSPFSTFFLGLVSCPPMSVKVTLDTQNFTLLITRTFYSLREGITFC